MAEKFSNESAYNYVSNNPILNIDVGGQYKLPSTFINKYPNISKYIQNNMKSDVMNSPAILSAFSKNTGGNLNRDEASKALTNDLGPTIVSRNRPGGMEGANGFYNPFGHNGEIPETIELSTDRLKNLEGILAGDGSEEDKLAALTGVFMTLLHETTHYGDYLDGGHDGGEPGDDFEIHVWGLKGSDGGVPWTAARFSDKNEKYDKNKMKQILEAFKNAPTMDFPLPTVPKKD